MQKTSLFFFLPLQLFAATLSFYLCLALVRNDLTIEQKNRRWVSIVIWVLNGAYQAVRLGLSSSSDNWGVDANQLYCKSTSTTQNWWAFLIPTMIMTFFATIFTSKHKRRFTRKQSRRTAIELGQAIRLLVCNLVYILLLLVSSVPRMVKLANNIPDDEKLTIAEYSGSIIGICLFLIFGTNRSAALCLPCFYYETTESLLIKNTVKLQKKAKHDTIQIATPTHSKQPQKCNNSETLELEYDFSNITDVTTVRSSPSTTSSGITNMTQSWYQA
ncbi:14363_t:CDS:2 [Ambispora leptoticha]|uniref:14363_t:CDS:1 n=1 Tax=Ambispora leptoticha TaxID=144679 RepID=A0A9N9HZ43_9GLOM|nr:14363_t:CDS:2 [Ambispora leptoticha]